MERFFFLLFLQFFCINPRVSDRLTPTPVQGFCCPRRGNDSQSLSFRFMNVIAEVTSKIPEKFFISDLYFSLCWLSREEECQL